MTKRSKTLYLDCEVLDTLESEGYNTSEFVNDLLRRAILTENAEKELAILCETKDAVDAAIHKLNDRLNQHKANRRSLMNRITVLQADIDKEKYYEKLAQAMKPLTRAIKLCDYNKEMIIERFSDRIAAIQELDPDFDIDKRIALLKKIR